MLRSITQAQSFSQVRFRGSGGRPSQLDFSGSESGRMSKNAHFEPDRRTPIHDGCMKPVYRLKPRSLARFRGLNSTLKHRHSRLRRSGLLLSPRTPPRHLQVPDAGSGISKSAGEVPNQPEGVPFCNGFLSSVAVAKPRNHSDEKVKQSAPAN